MRINNNRLLGGISAAFVAVVFLFSFTLFGHTVQAAADTVAKDQERRILFNFANCISKYGGRKDENHMIDTLRDYEVPLDPIAYGMDNEKVIVGLDIDGSKDGVMNCAEVILRGAKLLSLPGINTIDISSTIGSKDAQKEAVGNWLKIYLTGSDFTVRSGKDTANWEAKLTAAAKLANDRVASIGQPSGPMIQRRFVPLLNMCYTPYASNTSSTVGPDDITTPDGIFLKAKSSRTEILGNTVDGDSGTTLSKAPFLGLGGQAGLGPFASGAREVFLGRSEGITLGFEIDASSDGNWSFGADFYPIGQDLGLSLGHNGAADCKIFKNATVAAAVFDGQIQVVNGEVVYKPTSINAQEQATVSPINNDAEQASCETSGFTLSWITCGIINGLAGVTQGIFTGVIQPYLQVSPIDTRAEADNSIFKVWSAMRNIANIILVFALLFVVFGQSIGGGIIDAYTAKKVMPRILAAAVLINLSIYIVAALVDIFNVVGSGIGNLILGPFKNTIFSKFKNDGAGNSVAIGVIIATIVGVLLTAVSVSIFKSGGMTTGQAISSTFWPFIHFILVFVLLPAVLVTLAIFATLILRQGIILILVVVAPIAFALFALPNTEKYFKKWWETLTAALMVYPIITVLFSGSIILAALAYNNVTDGGIIITFIGAIVSFIILIIPLALIPFSFKLAGGILGNLMNSARGITGKAGNWTQNRYKEQKALERKSLFDEKWGNRSTGVQKRIAARAAGMPEFANRVGNMGGRAGSAAGRGIGVFSRRNRQNTQQAAQVSQAAFQAGSAAEQAALGAGFNAQQASAARQAATAAHTAASASGVSPEAVRAASLAAGTAAARGQNGQAAGTAAATAYDAALARHGDAQTATVAARSAGTAAGSGSSREAASSAARQSGEMFARTRARMGDDNAARMSDAAGAAAASAHDASAQRNGGNHTVAASDATAAANHAQAHYEHNLNATGSHDAAATATMAGTQAYNDFAARGPVGASEQQRMGLAAETAAQAHTATQSGGGTVEQARTAGLNAGRTIR